MKKYPVTHTVKKANKTENKWCVSSIIHDPTSNNFKRGQRKELNRHWMWKIENQKEQCQGISISVS